MKPNSKFDAHSMTTENVVNWIKMGDFEEAKNLARQLAFFLNSIAENKDAQRLLIKAGVFWIGSEYAKFISERLLSDPNINMEAQREFADLIKAGHKKGSAKLSTAIEKLREKTKAEKGKSAKSGAELFAKVLVPNKSTKSQFEMRWFAAVADRNIERSTNAEYERVTNLINSRIDVNNQIISDWKNGKRKDYGGFSPSIPKRKISPDMLRNYHKNFKSEIDSANGITRRRIK